MGNVGGIIRDQNLRTLDRRLNADRGVDAILKDLAPQTPDLAKLIAKPRNASFGEEAGKIKQSWLDAQKGFFSHVPLATRRKVLRDAFKKALELRRDDAEGEVRRIRTVWICLWQTGGNQPFAAAVLESRHEITILLLAFRKDGLDVQQGAGQDRVFLFGTNKDLFKLFKVGKKDSNAFPAGPIVVGDDPTA